MGNLGITAGWVWKIQDTDNHSKKHKKIQATDTVF